MSSRLTKIALLLVGLAVLAGAGFIVREVGSKSTRIATRWVCPCVYVEGRTLDYCMSMTPVPIGRIVSVEKDDAEESVSATSFFVFRSKARRVPRQSCVMEY